MSVSKRLPIFRVGERIDNPRFYRKEEQALSRAHRKLSKAHKGTLQWDKRRKVVARVNPAYTSQSCSGCGLRQEMPLSVRVYECSVCGLVIDRDYNGSQNILDQALEAVGRHGRVIPEALGTGAVGSRHENSERHSMTW